MHTIIGIDPGKTTGIAILRIQAGQLVTDHPIMAEARDTSTFDDFFRMFSVFEVDGRYGLPGATIALESIQSYGRVVGKSVFETAYMVGATMYWAHRQGIELIALSKPQHLTYTVGAPNKISARDLRLSLENRWGVEALKKANCRNDHKRDALSVATAVAIIKGFIKRSD